MLSRSCSILTRGHIAKNAITYITSGFILFIEEIPSSSFPNQGGRGGRKDEKYKDDRKWIKIILYINNEKYVQTKLVNKDIKITKNNVLIEWKDNIPKIRIIG